MPNYAPTQALAEKTIGGSSIRLVHQIILISFGVALIALAAKTQMVIWPNPTPFTMQTLAIFSLSAAYGSRLAVATVFSYLVFGALGAPVLAGNPAITGGYLAGFVIMAYITGLAADRGWSQSPFKLGGAMLVGEFVMLAMGALWMGYMFGSDKIIAWGIGPFIVTDLVKLALAACLVPALWVVLKRLLPQS